MTFKHSLPNCDYWAGVLAYFNAPTPPKMDGATIYALEVVNGLHITSQMVFYACARHLLFLFQSVHNPDFPFVYQTAKLEKIQKFCNLIIIPETKKPFVFLPFRQFMAGFIFGWVYKTDRENFITSEVFDIEARKQWKSSFWAMVALGVSQGLLNDGRPEIFFCGATKDSSKIPYNLAYNFISHSKGLRGHYFKNNTVRILSKKSGLIRAVPFDKTALEGQNPSMVILTEYHLHKDDTMAESALSSRNASRKNHMVIYDTTKGHNLNGVCQKREADYKRFLTEQILNPQTLHASYGVFLWAAELDEVDYEDWTNPKLWVKANPGLGVTVELDCLMYEFNKITTKSAEAEFMAKRLGMWVATSSVYFDPSALKNSNDATAEIVAPYLQNNFAGLTSIMGLDLSSTRDTTSICLMWEIPQPDNESIWVFQTKGFIPEANALKKELMDAVPYRDWVKKGFIEMTPGESVDYNYVSKVIENWRAVYNNRILCYDPWQFQIIKQYLLNNGIYHESELKPVKQGQHLTPFFRAFERKLDLRKINFLANEFSTSHILNAGVKFLKTFNGNIIIQKVHENRRIDAFASMLFCVSERVNVGAESKPLTYARVVLN